MSGNAFHLASCTGCGWLWLMLMWPAYAGGMSRFWPVALGWRLAASAAVRSGFGRLDKLLGRLSDASRTHVPPDRQYAPADLPWTVRLIPSLPVKRVRRVHLRVLQPPEVIG